MTQQTNDTLDMNVLPFWQWQYSQPESEGSNIGIPSDSIYPVHEMPDTIYRQSMFTDHLLQVDHTTLQPRENRSAPTWVFFILLLIVGLQCLYFRIRKLRMLNLLKAAGDIRALDRLKRDSNLNFNYLWLPMGMLMVSPIVLLSQSMLLPDTGLLVNLAITAAAVLFYILRNRLFRFLGNIFDNKQGVSLYIASNYVYHQLEGIFVVVMLFLFFYLPGAKMVMLYIILVFLIFAFLIRFVRGMKVFLTHPNGSNFYLFYYLCIVEIAPVLVVIKWFLICKPIS